MELGAARKQDFAAVDPVMGRKKGATLLIVTGALVMERWDILKPKAARGVSRYFLLIASKPMDE
jgi:hypothetical protein